MVSCKTHLPKLLLLFLAVFLCFPGVMAIQYISFAQPDTLTQKDIYLYNASGSLLGLYNTTSTAIEIPATGDLMFVLKPQYGTPLDDPATWLASLLSWAQSNAVPLLFLALLLGYVVSRRH
jgi:hypothetical protein